MECVQIEIRRIRRLVTRIEEKRVLAKIWEKKGRRLLKDVSFKDDEQRSGDVGNASAKKVASESDNDGNDCEPSVQDTNKSADVMKVRGGNSYERK